MALVLNQTVRLNTVAVDKKARVRQRWGCSPTSTGNGVPFSIGPDVLVILASFKLNIDSMSGQASRICQQRFTSVEPDLPV